MTLSNAIRFRSERFDFRSELPDDFNAGNRFYGRDLAEYLSQQLSSQGLPAEFLDEDWGWQVFATRECPHNFLVSIYNLSEHREGGRPGVGEWGLWVQAFTTRKLLGLFSRQVEVAVPPEISLAVATAIAATGAQVKTWDDGPESGD